MKASTTTIETDWHLIERTAFPGHWACSCGHVGTDSMMAVHMAEVGWCPECGGSGSDAYPSLGVCRECHGTGETVPVVRGPLP